MKLSTESLASVKPCATINKGILISPGNVLRTRTQAVYAEAAIKEDFPIDVGIHDLSNLLNVVALLKDPEVEFGAEYLRISEPNGRAECKYGYAGTGMVTLNTKRKKNQLPAETIEFVLTEENCTTLQ